MPTGNDYVLGHARDELERLARQARLVDPITRRYFVSAGIREGMRVLDVGSGAGHTAMLLADIVGPTGEVVGADLSLTAIEWATRRVSDAGVANISFRHGDPSAMDLGRFDAIAGRYVLMFMPDPAATLARLSGRLRPGGTVVFHELDWTDARCAPSSATYRQVCDWIRQALVASGADDVLGTRLAAVFALAGLQLPTLGFDALVAAGPPARDVVRLVTDLATTLRPDIERLGLVASGDADFAELAESILTDLGPHGTAVGRAEIGAWATI